MFTLLFVLFLLAGVGLRVWLATRQVRCVRGHRNAVPPEFAGRISLQSHQRAADYTLARIRVNLLEQWVDALLLIGLTLLGGLQFLNRHLGVLIDDELPRQLALIASVLAVFGLVELPFSVWRKFRLEARYGFNRMTPRLFIADLVKGLSLATALGLPLTIAILWLMANTGTAWTWWAWGVWVVFNILILWAFPTVIAPLFNKFTPLDDPKLTERVRALMTRCGFELNGLFVMDGSKRSAHGNAYFTGFGKARRIVFFDTLLARLEPGEIEAVLAHELGHFKHRHILRRMTLGFILSLGFFLVLGWVSQRVWFYTGLGVLPQLGRPNDALALILFFLAVPVFTFWVAPLGNWLSRRDEFQADQYSASQCPPRALISALVKLYDDNAATLTPDPIHSAFYDSHPPAVARIRRLDHG